MTRVGIVDQLTYEELPDFLTPEEFAARVRISRNSMYERLRRGEIPHMRLGRTIRIPKRALLVNAEAGIR